MDIGNQIRVITVEPADIAGSAEEPQPQPAPQPAPEPVAAG